MRFKPAFCFLRYLRKDSPTSSSDGLFASGSHAGELILWDAIDWNIHGYEHILWEESQVGTQPEIRLAAHKPSEMSIQHLTTNGRVRRGGCGASLKAPGSRSF